MKIKDIEKSVDLTIEDMKNVFNIRNASMRIPLSKIGILRYFFLKNFKTVEEEVEE